uniref:Serine-threonine/tyrosine-protein kinase catalytic domain-containing protein n=2 Tax=Leersia perrieri TaxID=77586 RepID=A0A0D9XZJ8_9ORYZ
MEIAPSWLQVWMVPGCQPLIWFCLKYQKLHLVYDYMPHDSLSKHLFVTAGSPTILSWDCRSKIITGAAQGLHHFHIHGCVTSSNILIESDFTACLGDFGSSDLVKMSSEMDVFFFGVVVIEVVSGHRSSGDDLPMVLGNGFKFLVDWVWALHEKGCILDALDANLGIISSYNGCQNRNMVEAKKILLIGLARSHPDPKKRLKIETVVDILKSNSMPPPQVPQPKPNHGG